MSEGGVDRTAMSAEEILAQESLIDQEIQQELEKYKLSKNLGMYVDEDVQEAGSSDEQQMEDQ